MALAQGLEQEKPRTTAGGDKQQAKVAVKKRNLPLIMVFFCVFGCCKMKAVFVAAFVIVVLDLCCYCCCCCLHNY